MGEYTEHLETKARLVQATKNMRKLEATAKEARYQWEDAVFQAQPFWTYGDIAGMTGLSRVRIDQVLHKVRKRRGYYEKAS